MVTHTQYPNNNHIYAKTIFQFYNLNISNNIPPIIRKISNARCICGLHKGKNDKSKLRPVAVGGGRRRAFTFVTIKHNTNHFTEFIPPHNYAIRVKGGSNFVYNTMSCEIGTHTQQGNQEKVKLSHQQDA